MSFSLATSITLLNSALERVVSATAMRAVSSASIAPLLAGRAYHFSTLVCGSFRFPRL